MDTTGEKNRATVAFYGPDDTRATKLVVGILPPGRNETSDLRRWVSGTGDIRRNEKVIGEMKAYLTQHDVGEVLAVDRIIGCPHESGLDYPEGEECPFCPFWAGRDRWTAELIE